MTREQLIAVAGRARVKHVPAAGFLIDDQPTDPATTTLLNGLMGEGLLMRAASDPDGWSLLLPTLAAFPTILTGDLP
jgi:hypothetical protein